MENAVITDRLKKRYFWWMLGVMLIPWMIVSVVIQFMVFAPPFPFGMFSLACLLLLIYNICSFIIYFRLMYSQSEWRVRFFMIHPLLRLFIGAILVIVLVSSGISGPKSLLISFGVYFLLTLIGESYVYVQLEKQLNESQNH